MKKLSMFFKEFFSAFPFAKSILILSLTYGILASFEIISYYSLFRWNQTLIGQAPSNYFTVITVAVAYCALILVPQTIFEMFRTRKLKQLLLRKQIPYKKIIKGYSISFPRYNEFKIFDKENRGRNAISFMTLWIYVGVFLFGFFVLLRVSEVDDFIALPALAITAVICGVALSIFIRLVSNYVVRKVFWGKVDLVSLVKADTLLMEETEVASNKRTVFRMRVFIACQILIMLFIMLSLYFIIDFAGLMIGTGCSVAVALALISYSSLKKYEKEEKEDERFTYSFKE